MKLIQYWRVELFQHTPSSSLIAGGGINKTLLFEGYSKDKPTFRPGAEFTIELLTTPSGAESRTVRTCSVDSMLCTPVYADDETNPQRGVMIEYLKTAIGEGYQPEYEAAVGDLSVIDGLDDCDLNREFGKCWQWYNMGGGLHETYGVEEEAKFGSDGATNKHVLKSQFFTIEYDLPTPEVLNNIFTKLCEDFGNISPSHQAFHAFFNEMVYRTSGLVRSSMRVNNDCALMPNMLRGKKIKPKH